MVTDLLLQATQKEPYRALVLSRLRLSRSTDHQDRNLHSLSHRFQFSCSQDVFCMSVNMYVFNLKSCKECHKTRKKSRK